MTMCIWLHRSIAGIGWKMASCYFVYIYSDCTEGHVGGYNGWLTYIIYSSQHMIIGIVS